MRVRSAKQTLVALFRSGRSSSEFGEFADVKGLCWNCPALGSAVGIGDSGDLVLVDQLSFQFW